MSWQLMAYRGVLRRPWRSVRGVLAERHGLWLQRRDAAGHVGWGEVVTCDGFGSGVPLEAQRAALLAYLAHLDDPTGHPAPPEALPCEAQAGVEMALLDLQAQQRGCRLMDLLATEPPPSANLPVCAVVDDAVAAQTAVQAGAQTLKIKLGRRRLDDDVGHVAAIYAAVPRAVRLRLDAGGAWPLAVARQAFNLLAAVSPEFIEQPVPADQPEALATLRQQGVVPVAADEAVVDADRLAALLRAGAVDVVVLKPALCGGLRATQRLARQAAAAGVRTVVSHAIDSPLGRRAAAHLAAALWAEAPEHRQASGLCSPYAAVDEPYPKDYPAAARRPLVEGHRLSLAPEGA